MDVTCDPGLKEDIKFNCDVSDARYWGYFSICGLLLRYRDLYRSERGLKPWANISRTDIGEWIHTKEARWPELEHREFRSIPVFGKRYRTFDVAAINRALAPQGLVYGAGYGMYMKPTFFLAEQKSVRRIDGITVHTSGREFVRDLLTAPSMLQGETIFLRLETLMNLLYFKLSEAGLKKNSTLEQAFAQYGFHHRQIMDDTLERRLEELTERYADIVLQHEIAEYREGIVEWKEILAACGDRTNEHYLRALKDLIADTSGHGPLKRIIETEDRAALGLSISFMEGFRKVLYPEIRDAYAGFTKNGNWDVIKNAREQGYAGFVAQRERVLDIYRISDRKDFPGSLKKAIST